MNIIDQAQQAYAPKTSVLRTSRSTEHQLFMEATVQLRKAAASKNTNFADFAQAIHANRAIWTHLATQVVEDDNALSDDIRARIFYLAEFTSFHSKKVLQGDAEIGPLVEINTAMMRGLSPHEDV